MANLKCECGCVIHHAGWGEAEFLILPQLALEEIGRKIESKEISDEEVFFESIDRKGRIMCECPDCGRFHVKNNRGAYVTYVREHD
jgi:hypothetical protein